MNTTNETPLQAIPTTYGGVQLRSRMEAQCGLLFDTLGWKWEYEPVSIMLPNGVAYRPDFWLPEYETFVECRGYESEKGACQIEGFRAWIQKNGRDGNHKAYLTIGPVNVEMLSVIDIPILSSGRLMWCVECKKWTPTPAYFDLCHKCFQSGPDSLQVDVLNGKVLVQGKDSSQWAAMDFWLSERRRFFGNSVMRKFPSLSYYLNPPNFGGDR